MDESKELPKPYQELAETIGAEATLRLCQRYGGEVIYIPKMDKIASAKRRELIREEWNGNNAVELARRHNMSVRAVQKLVETLPSPQVDGQISMDELLAEEPDQM